jgi:hypothetical protein
MKPARARCFAFICLGVASLSTACGSSAPPSAPAPVTSAFDFQAPCSNQIIHVVDDAGYGQANFLGNYTIQAAYPQWIGITTIHTSTWKNELSGPLYDALGSDDAAQWQAAVGSRADFQSFYASWLSRTAAQRLADFSDALLAGDTKAATQFALMAAEFWTQGCSPIGLAVWFGGGGTPLYYGKFLGVSYPNGRVVATVLAMDVSQLAPPSVPPDAGVQFEVQTSGNTSSIVTVVRSTSGGTPVSFRSVTPFRLPSLFVQRLLK